MVNDPPPPPEIVSLGLENTTHMLPLLLDHRSVSKEVLQGEAFYVRPGRGAAPGDLQPPGVGADWLCSHSLWWIWFYCKYDKDRKQFYSWKSQFSMWKKALWLLTEAFAVKGIHLMRWSPTFFKPRACSMWDNIPQTILYKAKIRIYFLAFNFPELSRVSLFSVKHLQLV